MAASALGIYFAHTSTPNVFFFLPRLTHEVDRPENLIQRLHTHPRRKRMSHVTRHHFSFPQARVTENARTLLGLSTIVTGLLLTLMALLTGCASGGESGSDPSSAAPPVATVSLEWQPVRDPSVIGYFVYYSRRSSGQPGSCTYDSSMYVNSPSATVPNLDPHTIYYFAVSAYNGLESPCSEEISTITSSPVI